MPLVQVPRDLKKAALDIAIWEIATMKGFNPENPADATFRMRYEDAIKWLKGVGCGSISPDGLLDSSPDYSGSAPEVFSDELRGW